MAQGPDQFCGICGKQRAAGMSVCPNCGSPYERPESGSLGGSQNSMQVNPGEGAPKPTNVLWGVAPPPMQYSGMFPQTPATPMPGSTPAPEKRFPWGKIALAQGAVIILLLVVLITVLLVRQPTGNTGGTGVAAGATATSVALATSTSAPTATATPVLSPTPSLPCNVDVGTWTGSADWKNLNGTLINDGSNVFYSGPAPTIVVPCQLGNIANYAVETKIQVIQPGGYNPCFGITVRGTPTSNGWQGYNAVIGGCGSVMNGIDIRGPQTPDVQQPFVPGKDIHIYRVEVKDNTIQLFIDGSMALSLTDNHYLTGTQVGLWCAGPQISVLSFQVTSL